MCTSEVLRKILVAGAAVAALSVVASEKRDKADEREPITGGVEPEPKRLDLPS